MRRDFLKAAQLRTAGALSAPQRFGGKARQERFELLGDFSAPCH
jgi:hypothetical protein